MGGARGALPGHGGRPRARPARRPRRRPGRRAGRVRDRAASDRRAAGARGTTEHLSAARPSRSPRFRDEVALFAAIRRGRHATLRRLLQADPTLVSATESWSWEEGLDAGLPAANEGTPLIRAVEAGDPEAVDILLTAGAPVDEHCHCTGAETPLWTAVLTGRDEIAMRLLRAGADVNATSFQGSTPLHAAAQRAPRLMDRLLAAGADPDATDARGRTAADWLTLSRDRTPHPTANASGHLPSGIRALDLFAPIRRGARQYWPPAVKVGQTVLLHEVARALAPADLWWIGFATGPYDLAGLEQHSRELGVEGHCRIAPEGMDPAERRRVFADALTELGAAGGDALVVLLTAEGFRHEVTLAAQTLSTDPAILCTAVVEPQLDRPPALGRELPEGGDAQIAFDPRRARAGLFPALDPEHTLTRDYPGARHARLAERARELLTGYVALDPTLALPDPATLGGPSAAAGASAAAAGPSAAAAAQQLLRYLRQPFVVAEPFHSRPGESTTYADLLDHVEEILGDVVG